ncbi:hypothetical protein [Desulfosarcina alkanivorans]|nr:hypothetical protein [Desulfosarcina alkanivorans]
MSAEEMATFENIMGEIEGQEADKLSAGAEDDAGLDEDQQKAFESIMAQIEGEAAGDGDAAAPAASREEPERPEATDEDDFAAELEKVAKAADTAEATPSAGAEDDAGLDEDQQKAFESIMAQIEGGAAGDGDTAAPAASREEPERPEATDEDDFAAELEKVAKAADTAEATPSAGAEDDAGLDEDQQKAFESIMAQIEGGAAGDGDAAAPAASREEPERPEATDEDDFAAELEKVAKAADTAEATPSAGAAGGEGRLDGDLQQPVEGQTGSGDADDTDPGAPDTDPSASADLIAGQATDDKDPTAAGLADKDEDEESQDISSEIKDILKEITSSDEESDRGEAPGEDIAVHPKKTAPAGQETASAISSSPIKEAPAGPSEPEPATKAASAHQGPAKTPPAPRGTRQQKTAPLREAPASHAGRKKKTIAVSAAILLAIALAGYYYGVPSRLVDATDPLPARTAGSISTAENAGTAPPAAHQGPAPVDGGRSDVSRLEAAAGNIDRLRSEVLDKRAEIEELRAYYQSGIDAEKQGVVDAVRNTGSRKRTLKEALAEPRIGLGLAAIQRRETYIRRLAVPVRDLLLNSESLLYLSRKAGLLAMMADRASDIDIDGFIAQADEIIETQRRALSQLNIDDVPATPPSLETIWQDIARQIPAGPVAPGNDRSAADTDNAAVWKRICEGDYSEKHRLTALSPQAARCMARWKGKDLFLNGVTDLSAEAARGLASWEGDWLGLNGLKELRPEAAVHLAQWKGKGLSLNGLSRLSPRVVAILSEWQGEQIELVNVKHMAHWENPGTRLFLSEQLTRRQTGSRK